MKRRPLTITVLCTCLAGFMFFSCSPFRRDEAAIVERLKKVTPLGTSYEVAAKELERHFGHIQKHETTGFLRQEGSREDVVGVKSIHVHLGDYYYLPIGSTSVDAYWGFDIDGKLVEIWVWKTTDSL